MFFFNFLYSDSIFYMFIKLTVPSCLLEPGIRRLNTVPMIFENFECQPQLFVHHKKKNESEGIQADKTETHYVSPKRRRVKTTGKNFRNVPFFSGSFRGLFEIVIDLRNFKYFAFNNFYQTRSKVKKSW